MISLTNEVNCNNGLPQISNVRGLKKWQNAMRLSLKAMLYILGYGIIIPLTIIFPKNSKYVVLISRFGDFEGNLKYLYLYLNSLPEEKEFIFLTDKKSVYKYLQENNFESWYYPSISTFIKLFRTSLIFVDGNEWTNRMKYFFLYNSKKVQIWHGTGLKTIGLLKPALKNTNKIKLFLRKENTYYNIVSLSSEEQVRTRSEAFRYGQLYINGLPRNDLFFRIYNAESSIGCDEPLIDECNLLNKQGFKLVLYAPTWRKNTDNINHLNLIRINKFAEINNIIFIIKLHPKHNCIVDLSNLYHIKEYKKTADIYPLLPLTDSLITDYSSIYLDYLLLNRPVIFYPYDRESYIKGERELLLDYSDVTPGPICYNQDDLEYTIHEQIINGKDCYKKDRTIIKKRFFKYTDGNSSARLWNFIKQNLI